MSCSLNLMDMRKTIFYKWIKIMPGFLSGLFIILIMSAQLTAQHQSEEKIVYQPKSNVSSERFFTDERGTILMNVNVWGHVNRPGRHIVFDGIDIATLLSVVGGPKSGASLNKVKIFREVPDGNGVYDEGEKYIDGNGVYDEGEEYIDGNGNGIYDEGEDFTDSNNGNWDPWEEYEDGQLAYTINIAKFLKTGDRSEFIKIMPNDTFIIPQKSSSYNLEQVGTLNTTIPKLVAVATSMLSNPIP